MRKMCKDCLHFDHCINIPSYPVTNNTIACDDWVSKDKYVPVVHGRWIYHTAIGAMNNHCECSVCNWGTPLMSIKRNYCPHCGAKMDGGNAE